MAFAALTGCAWDHVAPEVCFEGEVLPIFVTYCSASGCHNATDKAQGYDLTSYAHILQGTKPRKFADSRMIAVLDSSDAKRMPPIGHAQLSGTQIETIHTWVNAGAPNTQNCPTTEIDTIGQVTYLLDIAPMMLNNCSGCHRSRNATASLDLTDYNTVKLNSQSGRI